MTKVFSIYDTKAESYLPPFYFKTKAEAIRALETTVKDPNRETQKNMISLLNLLVIALLLMTQWTVLAVLLLA